MRPRAALAGALLMALAACGPRSPSPTVVATAGATETVGALVAAPTSAPAAEDYARLAVPLIRRAGEAQASLMRGTGTGFILASGPYQLVFDPALDGSTLWLSQPGQATALALRPLGDDLNVLPYVTEVAVLTEADRPGVQLTGALPWGAFSLWVWAYAYNPGLLHYRLEVTASSAPPPGDVQLEWRYADRATGVEAAGNFEVYAERAPEAAPVTYGYSAALDATLLQWVDLTELNRLIDATGYDSGSVPVRQGRLFGQNLQTSDLQRLPSGTAMTVYDSYLYLAPGAPTGEAAQFKRYLDQVADIYDLIAHPPISPLPDWQALARETLTALDDPDTWVGLDGQRYWRAYVSDTRQSAEAITQFDVALGLARYVSRYGPDSTTEPLLADALAALPNFYNPAFGLIQNSGPLAISGDQGRGDTWYELGHALKAAELGGLGYPEGEQLALDSQAAWTHFAETVAYRFPRFYSFTTWQGTEREPDAGGGYALYMLRLADLGCGEPCLAQAEAAVRAFPGAGFNFAYETHMTAMSALATVELADRTGDETWLTSADGPVANLLRLSWIYEGDHGAGAAATTFFGLAPTQRAGAITPKEQYEAWIYLSEFLRRAHGRIDPGLEKLVAEFCYRTLVVLADSLPPRLPDGVATEHPSAYSTVARNRLDLYIPLEDLRDSGSDWGVIGQEVYGAGLAPTFAALAYVALSPEVTVFSGYPLAAHTATEFTLTGVPGTFAPVTVIGAGAVQAVDGAALPATPCGTGLCFTAEGGQTYVVRP
jgi:hypothetical protein